MRDSSGKVTPSLDGSPDVKYTSRPGRPTASLAVLADRTEAVYATVKAFAARLTYDGRLVKAAADASIPVLAPHDA